MSPAESHNACPISETRPSFLFMFYVQSVHLDPSSLRSSRLYSTLKARSSYAPFPQCVSMIPTVRCGTHSPAASPAYETTFSSQKGYFSLALIRLALFKKTCLFFHSLAYRFSFHSFSSSLSFFNSGRTQVSIEAFSLMYGGFPIPRESSLKGVDGGKTFNTVRGRLFSFFELLLFRVLNPLPVSQAISLPFSVSLGVILRWRHSPVAIDRLAPLLILVAIFSIAL